MYDFLKFSIDCFLLKKIDSNQEMIKLRFAVE